MILVAGLHLASWRCFLGVFAAVFATILAVVHIYVIPTAAMSGPAAYSTLLALRPRGPTPVSPPPQPVCDRLRTLGLWALCRPVWSRDGDPGLKFVRRRGCRAGRRAKRKQTLSADRTCPLPSSPAPSDHVSSSAVLGCLNVRSLLRKYDDVIELCRDRRIDLLCLTETWHDVDSAVLGRLRRAGYNRPRMCNKNRKVESEMQVPGDGHPDIHPSRSRAQRRQ